MSLFLDIRQSTYRQTPVMIGSSVDMQVDSLLGNMDVEIQKLFEDRNVILTDGGVISLNANGQTLSPTQNFRLVLNSTATGGVATSINLGSSNVIFSSSGYLWYAVVNRTLGTATIFTVSGATGLPSTTFANQEIFLLGVRLDSADGTKGVYLRGGTIVFAGQSVRIGSSSALDNYFSIGNATDPTKQIKFSTGGATTGTSLTFVSTTTANRLVTFPDATDTVALLNTAQTLANKLLTYSFINDGTTTGTQATLQAADITVGLVRLLSNTLISISGIPAGAPGQTIILVNQTTVSINILNDDAGASAPNRILTGGISIVTMPNNSSLTFTYDSVVSRWILTGSPTGSIVSVGTFDSALASPNGAVISGNSIIFQSATTNFPGMMNIAAQTFSGTKTFNNNVGIGANPNIQGASSNFRVLSVIGPVGGGILELALGTATGSSNTDIGIIDFFNGTHRIAEIEALNIGLDSGYLTFATANTGVMTIGGILNQLGRWDIGASGGTQIHRLWGSLLINNGPVLSRSAAYLNVDTGIEINVGGSLLTSFFPNTFDVSSNSFRLGGVGFPKFASQTNSRMDIQNTVDSTSLPIVVSELARAGTAEGIKFIGGSIDGSGNPFSDRGTVGWTSSHSSGQITINFTPAFHDVPTIVAITYVSGDPHLCEIATLSASSAIIYILRSDQSGNVDDGNPGLSFMAFGRRN